MVMFRTKWNSVGLPENPLPLILFFKWTFFIPFLIKFEKYQRAILGPSSPDSVTTIEKKSAKKVDFDQNKINLGVKTEEATLVWESVLKLLLYN